jgi:hypothetical protein
MAISFCEISGSFEDNFFNTMCYVERKIRKHLFVSISVSLFGNIKYGVDLLLLLLEGETSHGPEGAVRAKLSL